MFHRVKSETPSETDQVTETAVEEADAETAVVEEAAEDSSDQTENNETQTEEEKDSEIMNETTETEPAQEEAQYTATSTGYARPSQPTPSAGGYPGSYPGASSYASTPAQTEQGMQDDRTLTIGAGITMSGEIEACDSLVIEGTVEAALKGARSLDITQSGTFFGSVEIEEATIAGRFEGELTVTGRLTLRSGGVIAGSVVYGELEIEAGAMIDGRLTPIAAGQNAQRQAPKSKVKMAPKAKVTKSGQQDAANTDGGLFAAEA